MHNVLHVSVLPQYIKLLEQKACYHLMHTFTFPDNGAPNAGSPIWCLRINKPEHGEYSEESVKKALKLNCLTAHLSILPELKKSSLGKNAALVIGLLQKDAPSYVAKDRFVEGINYFLPKGDISKITDYHAWIQLDKDDPNSDVLDIVGPYNENLSLDYLNRLRAGAEQLYYYPVLTSDKDVFEFHAKLVSSMFLNDHEGRQNLEKYLTTVSKHLSISQEMALGGEGGKLTAIIRRNHPHKSKLESDTKKRFSPFQVVKKCIDLIEKTSSKFSKKK